MAYLNNIPQSSQTFAATQPQIQANFGFLNTSIGQEHNFDASDATKTYHTKVSMPNMADPVVLAGGPNGIYYVNGGRAKFYDGAQVGGLIFVAANAFIRFTGTGADGPLNAGGNTVTASYNIDVAASVKVTTGLYTIKYTNALASANCLGMTGSSYTSVSSYTTAQCTVSVRNNSGFFANGTDVCVFIFGA